MARIANNKVTEYHASPEEDIAGGQYQKVGLEDIRGCWEHRQRSRLDFTP